MNEVRRPACSVRTRHSPGVWNLRLDDVSSDLRSTDYGSEADESLCFIKSLSARFFVTAAMAAVFYFTGRTK